MKRPRFVGGLVALSMLVGGLASAGPNCNPSELSTLLEAAATVGPEHRQELVVMGLVESCEMPSAMEEAFQALSAVAPEQRSVLVYKVVSEHLKYLETCDKPLTMLTRLAEASPERKLRIIDKACDLKGLGSDEELEASDATSLLLGLLVRDWLRYQKMDAADALGRFAANLDRSPAQEGDLELLH